MNIGQMLAQAKETGVNLTIRITPRDDGVIYPRPIDNSARQRIAAHKRRKEAARRKDAKRRKDGRGKHRVAISRAEAAMRRAA